MNDEVLEPEDPAAAAFTRLEGEVALVRRAVQQLAAEKAEIHIPDYSTTLGELSKSVESAEQTLREIAAKPAMLLTPEDMARRIDRVAQDARQTNEGWMRKAHDRYRDAINDLLGITATLRAAHEQRLHLVWAASGGLVAGCLLWSILPGAIARALPERWQLPERMAAHIVGAPTLWEGGVRLMRVGSPEAYRAISAAAVMRHGNKEKIAECEKVAAKTSRAVRCTIQIENDTGR